MGKISKTREIINRSFQYALHKNVKLVKNISQPKLRAVLSEIYTTNSLNPGKRLSLYRAATINLGMSKMYSLFLDNCLRDLYQTVYKINMNEIGKWQDAPEHEDLSEDDLVVNKREPLEDDDDEPETSNGSLSSFLSKNLSFRDPRNKILEADISPIAYVNNSNDDLVTSILNKTMYSIKDVSAETNNSEESMEVGDKKESLSLNSDDDGLTNLINSTPEQIRGAHSYDLDGSQILLDNDSVAAKITELLNSTVYRKESNPTDHNKRIEDIPMEIDDENSDDDIHYCAGSDECLFQRQSEISSRIEECVINNEALEIITSGRYSSANVLENKETRTLSRNITSFPPPCVTPPRVCSPVLLHVTSPVHRQRELSYDLMMEQQPDLWFICSYDTTSDNNTINVYSAKIKRDKYEMWKEFNK